MVATVRLWDQTEEVFRIPIERKRDVTALFFQNNKRSQDRTILTYRVQIFAESGEVVEVWEHHFWTELIDLDKTSSAQRMRDSVSSHPMQESVIETP